MHVNYCRDESNAQEFLVNHDSARDFFEVSTDFFADSQFSIFSRRAEKLKFFQENVKIRRRFLRHLMMG